ncbi:cell adhesion molecule 3-like [Tachypleus tridentatus]|uniref:cell adhesion molecule 3-like n=1 Tax=Tachypleus tridentatus TaxID=6853 RepID=UPI003FD5ACB5
MIHIFTEYSAEFTTLQGGRVVLPCNLTNPSYDEAISLIMWYKGDSELPVYTLDVRKGTLRTAIHMIGEEYRPRAYFDLFNDPPSLKINPVLKKDSGVYTCRVDSVGHEQHTKHYVTFTPRSDDNGKNLTCRVKNPRSSEIALEDNRKLNVLYKPKLTLTLRNSNGNHRIKEGTCVYLDCRVIANPQIRDLQWKVDGRIVTSNQLTGIEIREQSLKLKNVTRGLEGRYHCTAQNIVGISRSNNISLVILPSPEPVQNCSVENLTLKSMKVVCSPGSRYEETKYHLVAYTTNGQQLLVNSTSFDCPVFIIDHLPADTLLVISIHSSNSQGNSAAVVLEARTLSSVEEDTRETTLLSVPLKITRHSGILVLT